MRPSKPIVGSILCAALATACVNRAAPSAEPAIARAPRAEASAAPLRVAADDDTDLTGAWESDWGEVTFDGQAGSYTSTYGTGPGRIELTKTGDRTYSGVWGESKARHGTMTVMLSSDGRKLTGKWTADADVTIGARDGGAINWVKKR